MNEVQNAGWSFADLKIPAKEKKIMDPITVLVYAALFPCFEQGSKVGLSGRTLTIQEPSDYNYNFFGIVKIPTRWLFRGLYREDNNNLEVFELNTMNAAEYYDPVNNADIRQLFMYAMEGIVAAKKPYEQDKSSPCAAIDKYQGTLDKAIKGECTFLWQLSEAEEKVKAIWTKKEIEWVNNTIGMILDNKRNGKSVDTDLDNMQKKLKEKEKEFNEICQLVKEDKLSILKKKKPLREEQAIRAPQILKENLIEEDEVTIDEGNFSIVVDEESMDPPKAKAALVPRKKEEESEPSVVVVVEAPPVVATKQKIQAVVASKRKK